VFGTQRHQLCITLLLYTFCGTNYYAQETMQLQPFVHIAKDTRKV